jgi:pimeloyl-ACP methyl ester carboxylesterase
MGVIRWILLVISVLIVGAAGSCVGGSLFSLDWDREHTARTEALPLLSESHGDGLVRIEARGSVFRARVAGLHNQGPGVILLHGFPETSAMWTPLLQAAASEGFRVVAFDQRGYSPGARPDEVSEYEVPELVADVLAVADALELERFHLVGHDWGCVVGWSVAIQHPDRVTSWAALSIPHPAALPPVGDDPPAYIRFFQTPWLPELTLTWGGLAAMRNGFYTSMSPQLREEYVAVFSEPGALTAALNWYRAIGASLGALGDGPVQVAPPVLFLWGSGEFWVDDAARARQRPLIEGRYAELELDAGHFLIEEQQEQVVDAILSHLRQASE